MSKKSRKPSKVRYYSEHKGGTSEQFDRKAKNLFRLVKQSQKPAATATALESRTPMHQEVLKRFKKLCENFDMNPRSVWEARHERERKRKDEVRLKKERSLAHA